MSRAPSLAMLAHGLELVEEIEAVGFRAPQAACGFANMALIRWLERFEEIHSRRKIEKYRGCPNQRHILPGLE